MAGKDLRRKLWIMIGSTSGRLMYFNQLVDYSGIATLNGSQQYFGTICLTDKTVTTISGHKYYLSVYADISVTSTNGINILFGGSTISTSKSMYVGATNTSVGKLSNIRTASGDNTWRDIKFNNSSSGGGVQTGDHISISNIMMIDLTVMFGEGNEPSTVEEFEAMFPESYYPYNAGEWIKI